MSGHNFYQKLIQTFRIFSAEGGDTEKNRDNAVIKSENSIIGSNESKPSVALSLSQDIVCEFEGYFAQYIFEASLKHKEFKEKISSCQKNTEEYINILEEFENFFLQKEKTLSYIFCEKSIKEYFKKRNDSVAPRMSILLFINDFELRNIKKQKEEEENLINIKEYSGLFQAKEDNKIFFCNDIPKQYGMPNSFTNPKINPDKVKELLKGINTLSDEDRKQEWRECYFEKYTINHPNNQRINNQSFFYQSVVTIPLSFQNAVNSETVDKNFVSKILNDHGESVLGLLCYDHEDYDFFQKEDTIIFQIVSDLFSLTQFVAMNFCYKSDTYKAYKLSKQQREKVLNEIQKTI